MVKFPDFYSVNTLSINFVDSSSGKATVYGNGRNQVAVIIKLSLQDRNLEPVHVSEDTLKRAAYLCNYYTGEKLPTSEVKSFFYSNVKNDYCNAVVYAHSNSDSDIYQTIELYISADGTHDGSLISCGISIDGIGDIDTSENGTNNKLPNGSTYVHQDHVSVNSITPIDYSDIRNITITPGDFEQISGDLGWTSRFSVDGPYKEHRNGTCKRRIVYIQPNMSTTHQQKFQKHSITYDIINNSHVNGGSISWSVGSSAEEDCFAVIKPGAGYPCAVIGRGHGRNDYQLNVWYSRKNRILMDGQMYIEDKSYYYRFWPYVSEKHGGDEEKGAASLLLYKFTLPEDNTYKHKWHDVIRPVTVNVTDMYGNEGSFQLTFDDTDHFDVPGIM